VQHESAEDQPLIGFGQDLDILILPRKSISRHSLGEKITTDPVKELLTSYDLGSRGFWAVRQEICGRPSLAKDNLGLIHI
jgi:hypothetical protein